MKKTIILALLVVAGCATLAAKDSKKDKKNKPAAAVQALPVTTPADSASYAAGYESADGLLDYLVHQVGVDTAYMADFIEGYREAMANAGDPRATARSAGHQIAETAAKRIFPSQQERYNGEGADTLSMAQFNEGFLAAISGTGNIFTTASAREYLKAKAEQNLLARNADWINENRAWLLDNSQQPGVVTLPSGLQYKVVEQGSGKIPTDNDKVVVKYEGRTIDGNVFDSSYKRTPNTSSFRCTQVIKGWTEALTMMPVGSTWELYIPQELAYGSRQAGSIKPFSTLIFKVELIGIEEGNAGK